MHTCECACVLSVCNCCISFAGNNVDIFITIATAITYNNMPGNMLIVETC